ncbi:MAG: heme o synthase [Bacteroidota bacterium]
MTLLVAISAGFGYTLAAGESFSWLFFAAISLGGFLITGASNVLNQVFEKEYDAKMQRTASRPVPTEKVNQTEAIIYALFLCVVGMWLIGYFFNLPAALLGIIGLLSYAFVYTPMKRHSPFAVFVGAIPGALPPLIGWVAVTGAIDRAGLILFAFQFFWQFPHFWAIAWLADADYRKAGFRLLPSGEGKGSSSSRLILIYAMILLPLLILPLHTGMLNQLGLIGLGMIGVLYALPAWRLHNSQEDKHAKQLLFASFFYLPIMQLIFLVCH